MNSAIPKKEFLTRLFEFLFFLEAGILLSHQRCLLSILLSPCVYHISCSLIGEKILRHTSGIKTLSIKSQFSAMFATHSHIKRHF